MIPKDAVKIDGDNVVIDATNVISPISIDEIPDDVLNYLEVQLDGEVVISGEKTELAEGLKLMFDEKEFTLKNIQDAVGETLPVGGKLKIIFPNSLGLASGEEHTVEVVIKTDNPISIKVTRTIA